MNSIHTSLSYGSQVIVPLTPSNSNWKVLSPYFGPIKLVVTGVMGYYSLHNELWVDSYLNFRARAIINGETAETPNRKLFEKHIANSMQSRDSTLITKSWCNWVSLVCGISHALALSIGQESNRAGTVLQVIGNEAILINNVCAIFYGTIQLIAAMEETKCYEDEESSPLESLIDKHKISACLSIIHGFESIGGIALSIFEIGTIPIAITTTFTGLAKIIYDQKIRIETNRLLSLGIIRPTNSVEKNLLVDFNQTDEKTQ